MLGEREIVPECGHQHAIRLLHQSQLFNMDLNINHHIVISISLVGISKFSSDFSLYL
jgi:hypothetical protein